MHTLHPIMRTKQLTIDTTEVLFKRNGLKYKPGDKVKLEGLSPYIASGIQEPWIRILLKTEQVSMKAGESLRVYGIESDTLNLINANEEKATAVYIAINEGIAPCLSYLSTFPQDKFRAIIYKYDNEGVNIDWLKQNQLLFDSNNLSQLLSSIPLNDEEYNSDYYIYGQGDTMIKDYLLNHGIGVNNIIC